MPCLCAVFHISLDCVGACVATPQVGNLPWDVTAETLMQMFSAFEPYDVHVKTNMAGKSRGECSSSRSKRPWPAKATLTLAIPPPNRERMEGRWIG